MRLLINLSALLDDAKCFELVRQTRWPQGVRCPKCGGEQVVRNGHDDTRRHRQRYIGHFYQPPFSVKRNDKSMAHRFSAD